MKIFILLLCIAGMGIGFYCCSSASESALPAHAAQALSPTPTPSLPQNVIQAPAQGFRLREDTYSLPGMECLVNEHGIRLKVIITREGVLCSDSPGTGTLIGQPLKYFRPYFIFDLYPRDAATQYYQIGLTSRQDTILGWVSASSASLWPTRVGARYKMPKPGEDVSRMPPLLVYENKESLIQLLNTGSSPDQPIAKGDLPKFETEMPWPIIETEEVNVKGEVHSLVKVDFLAEYRGNSPSGASEPAASPISSSRDIGQVQQGLRNLDIVFVIDATGSMQPYLDATQQAVRQTMVRLQDLQKITSIAFGLVFYRDYDFESGFVTRHPISLDPDGRHLLSALTEQAASKGGDDAEAVYDGLYEGLQNTPWRGEGLSERIVILIGDCPAHEPGDPQNPNDLTAQGLVTLASRSHAKILTVLAGSGDASRSAYLTMLQNQLEPLSASTKGEVITLENANLIVPKIAEIVSAGTEQVRQRCMVVEELGKGKRPEQISLEHDLDIHKVTDVMEFLSGAGIDVSKLQPGVPRFASGWALCEVNHLQVLEREVYVARAELDVLLGSLNSLCASLSPDFGEKVFAMGLSGRLNPLESFMEEDLPVPLDVFLMAKGIPVGRTSVLKLDTGQIKNMPEQERAALREKLARQIIPALTNARNDGSIWTYQDDLEFGWIPEDILP